eukprot:1155533-Pelagomonas_calceolata.AAC.2
MEPLFPASPRGSNSVLVQLLSPSEAAHPNHTSCGCLAACPTLPGNQTALHSAIGRALHVKKGKEKKNVGRGNSPYIS